MKQKNISSKKINKTQPKKRTKKAKKPRFLIAYYSLTGNTMKVAHDIAYYMGGELEQIHELKERKGIKGYLVGGYEAISKKKCGN